MHPPHDRTALVPLRQKIKSPHRLVAHTVWLPVGKSTTWLNILKLVKYDEKEEALQAIDEFLAMIRAQYLEP